MPDDFDPDDDGAEESGVIRDLRKKAKRTDEAEAERDTLRKENILLKSGIELDGDKREALLALVSDPSEEAFKEKAKTLGWYSEPEPVQQVSAEEQAGHQRMQDATAAAEASEAHPESPDERIAKAKDPDEVMAILAEVGAGPPDYGEAPTD